MSIGQVGSVCVDATRFLDHPLLKNSLRKFAKDDYLFRQGEPGQTLYVITQGRVRLVELAEGRHGTVALVGAGDFLGEKAILRELPYPRAFSALAETDVVAVEIGQSELALLEKQAPYLIKLLLRRSIELAEERLERANLLARVLRSSDNNERLLKVIVFFAKSLGRKTTGGIEVAELPEAIAMHINMPESDIRLRLEDLVKRGLLLVDEQKRFKIPDLAKIEEFSRAILKRAA